MIKKLRIKLVAASMVSLFLVLFVIGGIVGIINYKKIVEDADRILEILEEIVSTDTTQAIEYALEVWGKNKEQGFLENYRYWRSVSNGEVRIIFLDCRRQLDNFQNFLLTTFGVSGIGLLSVFVLMLYLSAHIVKPFSDNYEKQKRFITDAGHELKTPLTIIEADTEVLEMDFGENEWL